MTQPAYIQIPLQSGALTPYVAQQLTLMSDSAQSSIARVQLGFLDLGGPVGGDVVIRVGTNLDGVADVDYAEITVLDGAQGKLEDVTIALAAGSGLLFRLESEAGSATDLFGTLTMAIDQFAGALAGTLYATLVDVKFAIALTDATFDDEVTAVIEQVSRLFDNYVGRTLRGHTAIEFHDGWAHRNGIVLDEVPSEDSDVRDDITVTENGVELTINTQWHIDKFPSRIIYRLAGAEDFAARFASGTRNIKVNYRTAYSLIPGHLQRACTDESVRAWQNKNTSAADGGRIGLESRTPAVGTVFDYSVDDFSPMTLRALQPYREGRYV